MLVNTESADFLTRYYIEIDGVGEGDLTTGYGDYNSMGEFTISGTAPTGGGNLPVAAFKADKQLTCSGQKVKFTDKSTGDPTKWEWTFENGTPSTSIKQNPEVTYNKAGKHKVSLRVTNDNGDNTKTEEEYITITESKNLPIEEGFEGSFPPADWTVNNPDEDITWKKSEDAGIDSKSCLIINNAKYKTIGQKDDLIIPEMDLSASSDDPALTFFVAYTRFDEKSEDKLKVFVSEDCGDSWIELYYKTQDKLETKEVDFDDSQEWIPTEESDWRKEIIDLTDYKDLKSLQIRFESTNGYGNNIWIDNINIDYSLGANLKQSDIGNLIISPNPADQNVNINFTANNIDNYHIEIRNILGKTIFFKKLIKFSGKFNQNLNLTGLSNGVYLLNIQTDQSSISKKLIKQ